MFNAEIGDYVKFKQVYGDPLSETVISKVVAVHMDYDGFFVYETESGDFVDTREVSLEDILLPSEVEVG